MTEIKFQNENSHFFIGLSGHAGDTRVCACCSLLSTMVAQLITDSEIKDINEMKMEAGECIFDFDTKNASYLDSQMYTILRGFELLANEYPENVHLSSFED